MRQRGIFRNYKRSNTELGFGEKYSEGADRLMNKDGSFNVQRRNTTYHFYIDFVTMPWWRFILLVFAFYGVANLVFAALYMVSGAGQINADITRPLIHQFFQCYNFSAQTMTTVGYGGLSPLGPQAQFISIVEMIFGILCFAVATGLVYSRFSRPTASLKFSEKAIIAPYRDINSFQIRVANRRRNLLIEIEAKLMMSFDVADDQGNNRRVFVDLPLERNRIYFLPLSWTIVHPIDAESPFYGKTPEDLEAAHAEIMVMMKAHDDTFSQMVHAHTSYRFDEIEWGARFAQTYYNEKGKTAVFEIDKLGRYIPAALNPQKENIPPSST